MVSLAEKVALLEKASEGHDKRFGEIKEMSGEINRINEDVQELQDKLKIRDETDGDLKSRQVRSCPSHCRDCYGIIPNWINIILMFTNFCEKSGNEAVKKKQEVKSRLLVTYKNQYRIKLGVMNSIGLQEQLTIFEIYPDDQSEHALG